MSEDANDRQGGELVEQQPPVISVNVTDPDGVLLGRFPVANDELRFPEWIGQQVINKLPATLRPKSEVSAGLPRARPTREDMRTTVRTLDWILAIVGEQDRPDLQEPIHLARAFTQATLAAS